MATLEQIAAALKAADAAGNIEDAKALAMAYRQMQSGGVTQLTGTVAPKGSSSEQSRNVVPLDAEGSYNFALDRVSERYFPEGTDREAIAKEYAPYGAGELFNAGLTFGFNDEAAGAGQALGTMLGGRTDDLGAAYQDFSALERARQEYGAQQAGGLGVAAEIGGAVVAGRPDMAAGRVAGLLPNMVQGAKGGAFGGGVYGFGSSDGETIGERVQDAAGSALFGAGAGAAVPAAIAAGKKAVTPFAAPAAKTKAADILAREGIELTAGQRVGSQGLQFRESELGGQAASEFMERQAKQFTAAALKRIGVNAAEATPDVIDSAGRAIGQQFDDLAARNFIQGDQQMARDIGDAWRTYVGATSTGNRPPRIEQIISEIYGKGPSPRIDGRWYKGVRSELGRLSKNSNPEFANAARDLQHALDEAMERSLAKFNPADAGAWGQARKLYRNLLVIEDAATRAGAQAADGIITPQALRSATVRKLGTRGYARGWNDFTELANAGVSTMTPLPNSGTAGRLNAKSFLPIGAGTGATIGGLTAGIPGAAAGAVAGAAVPWAVGRGMLSKAGRAYLGNQVAAGPTGGQAAVIGALMARGSQPLLERSK